MVFGTRLLSFTSRVCSCAICTLTSGANNCLRNLKRAHYLHLKKTRCSTAISWRSRRKCNSIYQQHTWSNSSTRLPTFIVTLRLWRRRATCHATCARQRYAKTAVSTSKRLKFVHKVSWSRSKSAKGKTTLTARISSSRSPAIATRSRIGRKRTNATVPTNYMRSRRLSAVTRLNPFLNKRSKRDRKWRRWLTRFVKNSKSTNTLPK